MYTIYLLESFNNYFNRRVIRYETLNGYLNHQTDNEKLYVNFDANFIPNDGVATELIVNAQKINMDWNPDYILIVDSDNTIFQRWFVIDSVRTTMGQYRLSLKRDSFVDYYYEAINAPCLVEKATLTDDNPLIYNPENFVVNQIKQSETFLKDRTGSAWIVGYLSNGDLDMSKLDGAKPIPSTNPTKYEFDIVNEAVNNLIEVSDFYSIIGVPKACCSINGSYPATPFVITNEIKTLPTNKRYFQTNFEIDKFINSSSVAVVCDGNGSLTDALSNKFEWINRLSADIDGIYILNHGPERWEIKSENVVPMAKELTTKKSELNAIWGYASTNILSKQPVKLEKTKTELDNLVGNVYYDSSTGDKITVLGVNSISQTVYTKVTDKNALGQINNMFVGESSSLRSYFTNPSKNQAGEDFAYIGATITKYYLSITTENVGKIRYSLPADIRTVNDNPYRMFCIPFNTTKYHIRSGSSNYTVNTVESIAFRVALDISKKLTGAGWLSDLQILPYCPVESWCNLKVGSQYAFNMNETIPGSLIEDSDFTYIYDVKKSNGSEDLTRHNFILFPNKSTSSIKIDCRIPVVDKKVENQCNFQRLCSPNYASSFQFNAVKNNGVDYFTVNMTCRPWNPFIQVYPNFKELYGNDFNDNRGLILSGDFSLPQVNDAWNTYELNNKNYQATFDRSIQNMERTHKMDMIESGTGALAGTAGAATTGALIGTAILPGVGTAVGAAIGAGVGLIGGAADMAMNQYRFNETVDYTKDQFGYNLQNIQALPNTITKTSALTANHKLFPFIEFYSCTDKEKEAFRNKLKWNGMTVGVISDIGISPYIQEEESYIKAQIINIDIPDDAHIAQDIAKELYQGVRIKQ